MTKGQRYKTQLAGSHDRGLKENWTEVAQCESDTLSKVVDVAFKRVI